MMLTGYLLVNPSGQRQLILKSEQHKFSQFSAKFLKFTLVSVLLYLSSTCSAPRDLGHINFMIFNKYLAIYGKQYNIIIGPQLLWNGNEKTKRHLRQRETQWWNDCSCDCCLSKNKNCFGNGGRKEHWSLRRNTRTARDALRNWLRRAKGKNLHLVQTRQTDRVMARFLPHDVYAYRSYYAVARCLSICLSVTRWCYVKRLKVSAYFICNPVATPFCFFVLIVMAIF